MTAEPLSGQRAVFLPVDHQTGVFERVVKAPPCEQVEAAVGKLAAQRFSTHALADLARWLTHHGL